MASSFLARGSLARCAVASEGTTRTATNNPRNPNTKLWRRRRGDTNRDNTPVRRVAQAPTFRAGRKAGKMRAGEGTRAGRTRDPGVYRAARSRPNLRVL